MPQNLSNCLGVAICSFGLGDNIQEISYHIVIRTINIRVDNTTE